MRKHLEVRPFPCQDCGKQYISKWNMLKHQKHGCKIAEKAKHTLLSKRNFSSVSDIDNHEKTEKYIRLKIDSWLEKEKLIFGNNGKIDDVL